MKRKKNFKNHRKMICSSSRIRPLMMREFYKGDYLRILSQNSFVEYTNKPFEPNEKQVPVDMLPRI